MSLLLLVVGALFAVLFLLNNVFQTLRRSPIGFGDLLLAFLATLVSAAGVLLNYWGDAPDPQLDIWALTLGGALAALSLIVALIEVFRPQRLKGSRGVLGLFSGLLIAASGLLVPFVAAYFALQTTQLTPTQVAQGVSTDEATAEATAEISRGAQLFYAIRDAIRHEIQVEDQVITDALEAGTPLRQIVEQYDGDIEVVIDEIAVAMESWVREGIAIGEIGTLQGALLLSQMENIVRLAVNSDINRFADRFGRETPAPGETAESIFGMVSPHPTTGTPRAVTLTAPAATQPATATLTPTLTETPRPSRTPTPSRTRFQFSTRTLVPTLTPTEVVICQATVTNNLRLRAEANQDAETLLTVPADTIIFLSGRTEDSVWWQTEFEGQAGWVVGEFLLLSAACADLPITED